MKKETLLYTPMTPLEKKHIRRTALWMFGLLAAGCLALVGLVPLCCGVFPPTFEIMLGVGIVLMVAAIPLHILAGGRKAQKIGWLKTLYVPTVLINLVGVACFEAAYYTRIGIKPPEVDLVAGAVIPIALCLVCLLGICLLPHALAILPLIFGGVGVAGIVTCIVFWVKAGHTAGAVLWSFGLFNVVGVLIVLVAFVYAANAVSEAYGEPTTDTPETSTDTDTPSLPADDRLSDRLNRPNRPTDVAWGWVRYLSFASFGLFLIVAAVVLLILMCMGGDCDCDGGDCCDCGGSSGGESKGVQRKQRRRR